MGDEKPERFDPDRWLEPDARMRLFLKLTPGAAGPERALGEDWLRLWNRGRLNSPVPNEVINLIEQARACICYGYFFYPLYTLGVEQLSRVAEAAIAVRCDQLGAPKSVKRLENKIDWLADKEAWPERRREHWHLTRKLRNEASHRTRLHLLTPAAAAPMLWGLATDIQALFEAPPKQLPGDRGDLSP